MVTGLFALLWGVRPREVHEWYLAVYVDARPFTTLHWEFLARHRERFARHPRLALKVRNLDRLSDKERAVELRRTLDPG